MEMGRSSRRLKRNYKPSNIKYISEGTEEEDLGVTFING